MPPKEKDAKAAKAARALDDAADMRLTADDIRAQWDGTVAGEALCRAIADEVVAATQADIVRAHMDEIAVPWTTQSVLTDIIEALALVFVDREETIVDIVSSSSTAPAGAAATSAAVPFDMAGLEPLAAPKGAGAGDDDEFPASAAAAAATAALPTIVTEDATGGAGSPASPASPTGLRTAAPSSVGQPGRRSTVAPVAADDGADSPDPLEMRDDGDGPRGAGAGGLGGGAPPRAGAVPAGKAAVGAVTPALSATMAPAGTGGGGTFALATTAKEVVMAIAEPTPVPADS